MSASWISLIVLLAAVLRVADNLPLESELISSENENTGSISGTSLEDSSQQEPGGGGGDSKLSRDKRTIGILRQVFPGLSQIVDRKIQMLTRLIFRVIGRLVLRGGAGGGGDGATGTSSEGGGSRKISITLPTFPPSEDEEEEEEDEDSTSTTTEGDSTTTTTEASEAENAVAESKTSEVKVRVTRDADNDDQAVEATGGNGSDDAETDNNLESNEDNEGEGSEENPRNKRLLDFKLGGGGGGSGGGSGNFLFDIIRRTADGAARMAGTVYRVLAGTDDVGLPVYPPLPSANHPRPRLLVAGSGTTQEKDEAENAPLDDGGIGAGAAVGVDLAGKDDGYSAGVPGPLTRLFVIANRGISNLMQDLILRLAQTSERIVNFKARLITSII